MIPSAVFVETRMEDARVHARVYARVYSFRTFIRSGGFDRRLKPNFGLRTRGRAKRVLSPPVYSSLAGPPL